jgi:predicted DNA-binding protein (MmcQ/YjbR family)
MLSASSVQTLRVDLAAGEFALAMDHAAGRRCQMTRASHDLRRVQRILPLAPGDHVRNAVGWFACLEDRRQGFAIGGWGEGEARFTFKVSNIAYEILKEQPGLRPAPYLASRGFTWIQHFAKPGLSDEALQDYIRQSHVIITQGLSKMKRIELGLSTA